MEDKEKYYDMTFECQFCGARYDVPNAKGEILSGTLFDIHHCKGKTLGVAKIVGYTPKEV